MQKNLFLDSREALADLLHQLEGVGIYIPGEDEGQWGDVAGLSFSRAESALKANTEPEIAEGDYILKDGAAWFTVSGFAVRIRTAMDGSVVCSLYNEGQEDSDAIAECSTS